MPISQWDACPYFTRIPSVLQVKNLWITGYNPRLSLIGWSITGERWTRWRCTHTMKWFWKAAFFSSGKASQLALYLGNISALHKKVNQIPHFPKVEQKVHWVGSWLCRKWPYRQYEKCCECIRHGIGPFRGHGLKQWFAKHEFMNIYLLNNVLNIW